MQPDLLSCAWLPEPAENWRTVLKTFDPMAEDLGWLLRAQAMFQLGPDQSRALGRVQAKAQAQGNALQGLTPFRLGIAASDTFSFVADCLPAAALRHGLALQEVVGEYGQVAQSVLSPTSPVLAAKCDAVLIAVDHRWLGLTGSGDGTAQTGLAMIEQLATALRDTHGIMAIVQTLPVPPDVCYGSQDAAYGDTPHAQVAAFNAGLVAVARRTGAYLLDVARLAALVGTGRWFNPVPHFNYKAPFDPSCASLYAEWLCRLIGAIRGTSAKCLVLDLDNTLWGGVIGDDGVTGIVVGQGSARGEAHLALQRSAKALRKRGVFLAVASKNDDANARAPFRDHSEMILRESDFAVFQANWTDKAANLKAIAKTLNIGVDALVFVDDNPAERELIRQSLPAVRVLELPEDPAWYAWLLEASGWFETVAVTEEDKARADMQAADSARQKILEQTDGIESYLASLDMVATIEPVSAANRQRVTQLINKTNQFNLTTKRYTEQDVATFEFDPGVLAVCLRLADRFGDLGIVAVMICRAESAAQWSIDSFLMSCRVLGRQVEDALFATVAGLLRDRAATTIVGTYIPTAKNNMVSDLLDRLGFTAPTGDAPYTLDLESHRPHPTFVRVDLTIP